MMTERMKSAIKRHRTAAVMGGVLGAVLLIGFVAYEVLATPAVPSPGTSRPEEIVAFVVDSRGFDRLPQIEQQRFLEQWKDRIQQDPAHGDKLKTHFETMDEDVRKDFSTEIFRFIKRSFLDDAKRYAGLPQEQRYAFLRDRSAEYRNRALVLKDLSTGFSRDFSGSEDDLRRWVMEHTTPEERAVGEPYAEALKKVQLQIKKEERAEPPAASAPAAAESLPR